MASSVHFTDKLWGSAPQVLQKTFTILRLAKSYRVLEKEDWPELATFWKEVIEGHFDSVEGLRKKISFSLGKRVYAIYEPEVQWAQTVDEIKACAARFLKDEASMETPPVVASARGVKGVTLLGRYNRFSATKNKIVSKEFVLKLTDNMEVPSNHLYADFSTGFRDGMERYGFLVPKSAELDLAKNTHTLSNGKKEEIKAPVAAQLKDTITQLAGIFEKELQRKEKLAVTHVMLSERIDAENLYDFARRRFKTLSPPQKYSLIKQMGEVGGIDFLLLYNDRLFQLFCDQEVEFDELFPANLGNLLARLSPKSDRAPILYAIDNGIEPSFLGNEAHLLFLEKLLKQVEVKILPNNFLVDVVIDGEGQVKILPASDSFVKVEINKAFVDTLTQKMIASIVQALEPEELTGFRFEPGLTVKKLQQELRPLKEYVEEFGRIPLAIGLEKMLGYMVHTLISRWQNRPVVTDLDKAIASALKKRFEALIKYH